MTKVTHCLSVVFSPLLLRQASPSSLLSATSRGGGLPISSLSQVRLVLFCIVCIKWFLVFLLSLEFWHYFFASLLVGSIHVFNLKSVIVCCHLIWLREHHRF